MTTWAVILLLVTITLFLIPMLPGLWELLRPTDIQPLRVSQDYDSNPMHFADGFRNYVKKNFPQIHSEQNHNGRLSDGTKFQLVGEKGVPQVDASSMTNKLLLSSHAMTLPPGELFESEIFGEQSITTGERSSFRAILTGGMLHIREHSSIMRWAHADGEMMIDHHSKIYGRATSNHMITLGDNVHFERLHAPTVRAGQPVASPAEPAITRTVLEDLPDVRMQSARRWVLNGHLEIPARHAFDGDIVTGTTMHIGDYSHIKGSIKCNASDDVVYHLQNTGVLTRAMADNRKIARGEVGNFVRIDGTLISSHDLYIGQHCRITGPVIAENLLVIGSGTVIGSAEYPTTVTARRIVMESGSVVHGTIWATEGGLVRSASQQGVQAA